MLGALAITLSLGAATLVPTDDVWVYTHASDQLESQFLRSWGAEGRAVMPGEEETGAYSYSYLKFSLKEIPKDAKLTKAVLRLTHDGVATFNEAQSKEFPLEARALSGDFQEKDWQFGMSSLALPKAEADAVFGTGSGKPSGDKQPFIIEIDLMKGPGKFEAAFSKALESGSLLLALTTKMDPQEGGESKMYKYYSRSAKEEWRPKLILDYTP